MKKMMTTNVIIPTTIFDLLEDRSGLDCLDPLYRDGSPIPSPPLEIGLVEKATSQF
jgi:hypothetical protein